MRPQLAACQVRRRERLQRAAFREQQAHRAHPACPRHDGRLPVHRDGPTAARQPAELLTEREPRQAE